MFEGTYSSPFDSLGSNNDSSTQSLTDKYKSDSGSSSIFGGSSEKKDSSPFDSLGSSSDSSPFSSSSPFDSLGSSSMDASSSFESAKQEGSMFSEKASYLGEGSLSHDLNVRAQRYGQMSVTDKMRGIQSNRLNMEGDSVSLAESYSDKALDKRVMNGAYNVTITDIYSDRTKFEAYHGLVTDGMIDVKENAMLDTELGSDYKEENEGTLIGGYKVKEAGEMIGLTKKEDSPYATQNPFEKTSPFETNSPFEKEDMLTAGAASVMAESQSKDKSEMKDSKATSLSEVYKKEDSKNEEEEKKGFREIFKSNSSENFEQSKNKKNKEEEDEEDSKLKEIFKDGSSYGKAFNKEEDEDEDSSKSGLGSTRGTMGVYGPQSIQQSKVTTLEAQIKEITYKMSVEKLSEVISKYSSKEEKTHKDLLKINIAQQALKDKLQKQ